ncbi:MAG: hypothetical protein QW534_06895 [Candidatus Methanomethylicia archaeon]
MNQFWNRNYRFINPAFNTLSAAYSYSLTIISRCIVWNILNSLSAITSSSSDVDSDKVYLIGTLVDAGFLITSKPAFNMLMFS